MKRNIGFQRRRADHVQEELARLLPQKTTWEFFSLFDTIYSNLRARNGGTAGKEMLRLRLHEQLQRLVSKGIVRKTGREYHPVADKLATLSEAQAGRTAKPPRKQPAEIYDGSETEEVKQP